MYLFNGGGPGSVGGGAGSTDILISWIYRLTTGTSPQYSMAAAVTLIISIIVISISMSHSRNYTHLIWRTSKMNNSIKLKRRLTQTLTYLYLIGLSIVIIYPL